jgi:UDP-glucuronate 4-epimerase
MQILVTGAAGFIGSSLSERLVARGDEVVGLDNFDTTLYATAIKRRNLAERLQADPRFRFIEGDFLDEPLVDRLVGARPDVVVHLGALAGVRPSLEQPKRYQRVNVEGTLNLLEACRAHGVRRFVFASSSSVYGARSRERAVAFREDDPAVRPASPYAATKRAGELLCSNYSDLYGIATPSLRFFTVYGPRQRPEMAIHKFTRLIAQGRPVPFFGDGESARDYTFIDDILDGVIASIDRSSALVGDPEAHRVYNLGGSRTTTLARLVALIEEALGRKAILDRQPDQPGDVPITFADVTRASVDLDYAPRVPIEDGIVRFVRWFEAMGG